MLGLRRVVRSDWAATPFQGASVLLVDDNGVLGGWTGAGYSALAGADDRVIGTMVLTAAATGKRIALGQATSIRLTAPSAGTIDHRFVNGSTGISVSASDETQALGATAITIQVPSGTGYWEYLRVGGADIPFTIVLLRA